MDMMLEAYLTHEALKQPDIPSTKEPVWILGKKYNATEDLEAIRKDIQSRLWFTYRKGFISIGDSGHTSDKGWGCMLRCGQMILAQTLLSLHLGRDWMWSPECRDEKYLNILRMFEDHRAAPFSIHQIALMGVSEGKQVGEWFGPNTIAQVLKKLVIYDKWSSLEVHIALDNTLVINDIKRLCRKSNGIWKPLLIIIPLRLGLNELNPIYIQGLKACFSLKQSIGIIGGKPNHAFYFIGYVGDELLFLDPHITQLAEKIFDKKHSREVSTDSSYHCQHVSRCAIKDIDPSVAVCFYCTSEFDIDTLCNQIQQTIITDQKQPLFEICNDRPAPHWSTIPDDALLCIDGTSLSYANEASAMARREFDDSDDEFEILG